MKYLFLNHKMNLNKDEIIDYNNELNKINYEAHEIAVFPSAVYLSLMDSSNYKIGAQNVCIYENGSYTGEVSASQLASLNCSYCLVGHSERRAIFKESNEEICLKLRNLQNAGITPVLCVGESDKNNRYDVLKEQLSVLSSCDLDKLIIAYEPVYSIGTGVVLGNNEINEVILWIKQYILDNFSKKVFVLYGGSVNDSNIVTLNTVSSLDGFLIGKSSLSVDKVTKILEVITSG